MGKADSRNNLNQSLDYARLLREEQAEKARSLGRGKEDTAKVLARADVAWIGNPIINWLIFSVTQFIKFEFGKQYLKKLQVMDDGNK
ncbi:hypothetical protein [Virgibacillus siamensis]|uniref:hypothetical protein n=1 Tax=Virgibacillus siamensis TaxID=480071 RepID=UPI00098722C7|nr:hypothetical protein [Virgibacillus siamensis]